MRKRCLLNFIFLFIIVILFGNISALSVTPAKVEFDFKPNLNQKIGYSVFEPSDNLEINLSVEGELSEYVSLDKSSLEGTGSFVAELNLPLNIEKPGKHRIFIVVREAVDDEVIGTTIGTSVTIKAVIDIYVPYPGRYVEPTLKSEDVNIGEPLRFELDLLSQGTEDVIVYPRIEILSSENQTIDTLVFNERELKSLDSIKLQKVLDTTDYNPGQYVARAIVDYGKISTDESNFRVGELVINVLNYTDKIEVGGLQKFEIGIESGWNDEIDGAYADVKIYNFTGTFANFKTSSTSLTPWEKKTIIGYFETDNFTTGKYKSNITLIYYGKNSGRSSSEVFVVEFFKKTNLALIISIIAGLSILIIVGILIKKYVLKNVGKKKN